MRRIADQRGQATVELVALLPGDGGHPRGVVAGRAGRSGGLGGDQRGASGRSRPRRRRRPARRCRAHLPASLERGLRVRTHSGGEVRVSVRIPALPGLPSPGRARAGAHFEPQS